MMTEHEDGSVTIHGVRFVPLAERAGSALRPVPGMFALPGGGRARKADLPQIAQRLRAWMEGKSWT